jgi:hypothetical protein
MPNFSVSAGGFATGKTASNMPMYLTVIEEWADCDVSTSRVLLCSVVLHRFQGTVGLRMSLTYNTVVYNSTHA